MAVRVTAAAKGKTEVENLMSQFKEGGFDYEELI